MTVGDVLKLALAALLIGAGWMAMQQATDWITGKFIKPAT
jgi:hypothetical protein